MIGIIVFLYLSGALFIYFSLCLNKEGKIDLPPKGEEVKVILTTFFWFTMPYILISKNLMK